MDPVSLRVYVKANGTDLGYIGWGSNTDPSTVSWSSGPAGTSVTYFDYDPQGGEVNSGDYIELFGLASKTSYTLEVYNVATSSVLLMTGDRSSFSTP